MIYEIEVDGKVFKIPHEPWEERVKAVERVINRMKRDTPQVLFI